MEELKETRKRRQYYWAGLIEGLGEYAWENLANYDRQRWQDENTLADKKFEDLAGQIKLAEMGIIDDTTRPEAPQLLFGAQEYNKLETSNERTKARNARRRRAAENGRGAGSDFQALSSQSPVKQNFKISKNRRVRPSPKHPPGSVVWTEDRQMEAVQKWMDEMGITRPTGEENGESVFTDDSMENNETFSDGDSMRSSDMSCNAMRDSPLRFPEQDETAKDNVGYGAVLHNNIASQAAELSAGSLWTAEDNAIFEEAESAREAHRIELARSMSFENERPGLLASPKEARLAQHEHASEPPAKTISLPRVIEAEGVVMNIADSMAEALGQGPGGATVNRAEQTTPARDGESIMDALLIQLGTSELSLQGLALAATRDVKGPPPTTVMADEGNLSDVTAAAGSKALAPAATQGARKSRESYVAPTTVEDPGAFSLEALQALALAATQGVEDVDESQIEGTHVEQPAALTVLDEQALALAATNGLEMPGLSENLASDRVQREVIAVESALTVPSTGTDQEGAEVIAKTRIEGTREKSMAADFMDIDEVHVETVDMLDEPAHYHQRHNLKTSLEVSIKAQVYQSPHREMNHRPKVLARIRDEGWASGRQHHAVQLLSAAARLRAAQGPFGRYSKPPRDGMAEGT